MFTKYHIGNDSSLPKNKSDFFKENVCKNDKDTFCWWFFIPKMKTLMVIACGNKFEKILLLMIFFSPKSDTFMVIAVK